MLRFKSHRSAVKQAARATSLLLASVFASGVMAQIQIWFIHDIQGPGASSPMSGSTVTAEAIVTAVLANGFFIQEEDADVDADPQTSEGIFVFTSSFPPAAAVIGARVRVTGTIQEFVPTSDLLSPPVTRLVLPSVLQLSTGNPLPAAVPLTVTFPNPFGAHDQLERLEGMRVAIASMTVVAPTQANLSEPSATATSTGVFYGVVTGNPRPFREPGIEAPNPAPAGTIPPIPRFDSNPEVIAVRSNGQVGATPLDVATGAMVSGLVGVLDYSTRRYTLIPDPAVATAAGGTALRATSAPLSEEVTIASVSLARFFDAVNDPAIGDPVLTASAFNKRLDKAALAIGDYLNAPDIVAVQEVENLAALQALAATLNAASPSNREYQAFLVEGNDITGIDVGFLVKTRLVAGTSPRVSVTSVTQELAGALFVNPDTSTESLHDRPPLRLNAVINVASGRSWPVTVFNVHLHTRIDSDNPGPSANGWPTEGDRVRTKRQKQAEGIANLVQARQIANPNENIVVTGDFGAYQFNDGLAHLLGAISGAPVPDNETAVSGDGVDLVNPDLSNLSLDLPVGERYNRVERGDAELTTHTLTNTPSVQSTLARRVEFARLNADFPASTLNNATTAERFAQLDPSVAYFFPRNFATLNADDSGASTRYHAASDGLTVLRYLRGERGTALAGSAVSGAGRNTGELIAKYLDRFGLLLDVDDNGVSDAATDGLLILRYLLGFRNASLTANAIAVTPPPMRTSPTDIAQYLSLLTP